MSTPAAAGPTNDFGRLRRLAQKELRETLRDRRTVITLLLMPLLVYPLISVIFRSFLLSGAVSIPSDRQLEYRLQFEYKNGDEAQNEAWFYQLIDDAQLLEESDSPLIANYLHSTDPKYARFSQNEFAPPPVDKEKIADGTIDVAVIVTFPTGRAVEHQPTEIELLANKTSRFSLNAQKYVRDYLEAINRNRLVDEGKIADSYLQVQEELYAGETPKQNQPVSFGTLIPLILVLMTITGAVYPAIDLTAGERERGTLEALIAAPIPRMRILIAKFFAVLTVAMLTATLNLIGMLITVWAFRLEKLIFHTGSPSIVAILQVFGLLLLYAAFFSTLLLAVTSLAQSFKEAQAYLIPLILLAMAPSVVSLMPGLSISGFLAVVPMVNFVLLWRDIFQGEVGVGPCIIVITSTLLYSLLALSLASRIFGTDAILYGSHESFRDSLRRPRLPQVAASPSLAMFALTLVFAGQFVAIAVLTRLSDQPVWSLLSYMAALTGLFYFLVPSLLAAYQRIEFSSGFALRGFKPLALLAILLMGVSLWPLTYAVVTFWQQIVSLFGTGDAVSALHERLIAGGKAYIERSREVPFGWILITYALIPAFCEEWFFRGFFLQAILRRASGAWKPVVLSGVVFGVFHVLAENSADRLLPSTMMGILLGFVCWRTGSIIPSMFLHALHNATVVSLSYFHEEISHIQWLPLRNDALPVGWLVAVTAVGACGFGFLLWIHRKQNKQTAAALG